MTYHNFTFLLNISLQNRESIYHQFVRTVPLTTYPKTRCQISFFLDSPFFFSLISSFMDLEEVEVVAIDSFTEEKAQDLGESNQGEIIEPYVGMEFESEESARNFYVQYAKRKGFMVRVMQRRKSGIDGRTLARRLGCNKQGFSPNHTGTGSGAFGHEKKPRSSAREGCKATILVKMEKSAKWVVTRFVKEHNHPLVLTANGFSTEDDKDKKIEELSMELADQEHMCLAYREKLLSFMSTVEEETEELSLKIRVIVGNIRKLESEMQRHANGR